jgi:N-acetylmuramic acid 6-phosphate (MurNAc-6-P) etherase
MMVDVQSTHAKLGRRKIAMTRYLAGASDDETRLALERQAATSKSLYYGCEHSVALTVSNIPAGRNGGKKSALF